MMITANTLCNDRPVKIDENDAVHSYWGTGAICCSACQSVQVARESWGLLYN